MKHLGTIIMLILAIVLCGLVIWGISSCSSCVGISNPFSGFVNFFKDIGNFFKDVWGKIAYAFKSVGWFFKNVFGKIGNMFYWLKR